MMGSTALYSVIKNDATILGLVSTYESNPTITVNPKELDGWGVDDTTICIYRAVPVSQREEGRFIATWTVNCRAETIQKVEELGQAVIDAVNRQPIEINKGRFYCNLGFVIEPVDENDSYNMPIEVEIAAQKGLE